MNSFQVVFWARSFRYQPRMVSGVSRIEVSSRSLRVSSLALAATLIL